MNDIVLVLRPSQVQNAGFLRIGTEWVRQAHSFSPCVFQTFTVIRFVSVMVSMLLKPPLNLGSASNM